MSTDVVPSNPKLPTEGAELVRLLYQRHQDMGDTLARKAAWEIERLRAALTEIMLVEVREGIGGRPMIGCAFSDCRDIARKALEAAPRDETTAEHGLVGGYLSESDDQ